MRKGFIVCVLIIFSALAICARLEAREYDASSPPKPGERARDVFEALNARKHPVFLKYRTAGEEGSVVVTFASRGGKAYADVDGPSGRVSTIYDGRDKIVTIISHATKSYIVANNAPVVLPFEEQIARALDEKAQFTATSGSARINGERCDFDRIVWEDGAEDTLYFIPWTDTLKWWSTGDETFEILDYESDGAEPSLFRIPAGYRETKLPQ